MLRRKGPGGSSETLNTDFYSPEYSLMWVTAVFGTPAPIM